MPSVHPTTVGLTTSSHLHDPENLGYRALHRLVIYRIIELLHIHDDLHIVEDFESETGSSSVDGADGASNHEHASSSPLSYEEKIERLVDTIMDGRRLRFSPAADADGYTIYAMQRPRSQQARVQTETEEANNPESENGLEQRISAHPQNFGQVTATLERTTTSDPTGSASGSASGSAHPQNTERVVANTGRSPTPYPTARESSPDENVDPVPEGSASYGSSPDNQFQSIRDWSSAVQEATSKGSIVDGRLVITMGQAGVEFRTVSPIPFNIHKKARTTPGTPSISSHGSILDCSSPSFKQTCKAIAKQSYLDVAPLPVPATTAPHPPSNNDKGNDDGSGLPDDGSDPGIPGDPGNPEDIPIWEDTEEDEWEDIEDDDVNDEDNQDVVPNANVLRDIADLRQPGYLQYNSFYQDAKAKAEAEDATTANAGGPASTVQRERPPITPPDSAASPTTSFFTTHENPEHDDDLADVLAALEGVVITDSPDPQASSSLIPRPLKLTRSQHIANTLAALEGRTDPTVNSPSPIQRFVRPGGYYNNDVLVENLGPRLRHPKPVRIFDATPMLAMMEKQVIAGIDYRGGFPEGRMFERPSNPTPIRARYQGTGDRRVVSGGRLIRTSANPTPLRARYQQGEGSSS